MNTLVYNGYIAKIEIDTENMLIVGHVVGISDSLYFHTTSMSEIEATFHQCIDNYLEFCRSNGKQPNIPDPQCGSAWQYCDGKCFTCDITGKLLYSTRISAPDSEAIANLLDEFKYCPEKKDEILEKYNSLMEE